MSDERDDAIVLANKLLDQHWADPDDDLRVLARQLLRAHEHKAALYNLLRQTYSVEAIQRALTPPETGTEP